MPARRADPLRLTPEQLKNPLIRAAKERLGNIERYRGKYLRRLDSVNGDRRTRVEVFRAIERVTEQTLVRLDLATSVLGYLDDKSGEFVLNTQRGIAEDSSISAPILCRMFKTLDAADYVYRRIERVRLDEKDENGLHLVRTRVLVRFTKLFWNDLGLRYVYERVQKAAKKRREAQLRALAQRRLADMERHSLELHRREVSRQRWQDQEARKVMGDRAVNLPTAPTKVKADAPQRATGNDVLTALNRLLANKPTGSG
ncbi:hypothetical protein JFT44_25570 [Pseudomonas sp. MF5691]|uniref:hypothetical protein n=1 Tax=Pseudomonas sp. MF5691 TaxID=2797526 RepID=UPI0018E85D4F|nr:hypothetical protein [Pseudomonas sp. MF5691]MBJ2293293.1 hypothetical protein [Pseudomonas sp. MF5691]